MKHAAAAKVLTACSAGMAALAAATGLVFGIYGMYVGIALGCGALGTGIAGAAACASTRRRSDCHRRAWAGAIALNLAAAATGLALANPIVWIVLFFPQI